MATLVRQPGIQSHHPWMRLELSENRNQAFPACMAPMDHFIPTTSIPQLTIVQMKEPRHRVRRASSGMVVGLLEGLFSGSMFLPLGGMAHL